MNALDGAGQTNLSNNGLDVDDGKPVFSPGGERILTRAAASSHPTQRATGKSTA